MSKVFRDYASMDETMLEGYTIVKVINGVDEKAETGVLFYLEREISNATLGVEVMYNPELEEPFTISDEYVKLLHEDQPMGCCDCTTCRYRYIHFPNMDDWEISMQECLCDGEDYEEETQKGVKA